jgi:outer membrane lipoprotein-sorting protein
MARRLVPVVVVTLDATNFTLLANEIVFPDGSRLRNDFVHAKRNAPLPPDLFRPVVEADFKVVEPPGP